MSARVSRLGDRRELLARHQPVLKYDSQESYFADSAAEWTDNPGNRLTDKAGNVIATAGHGLSLAFLGPAYDGGRAATGDDRIGDPGTNYADQARRMHVLPGYTNRIYGHAVLDAADADPPARRAARPRGLRAARARRVAPLGAGRPRAQHAAPDRVRRTRLARQLLRAGHALHRRRSEERRVGKERTSGW